MCNWAGECKFYSQFKDMNCTECTTNMCNDIKNLPEPLKNDIGNLPEPLKSTPTTLTSTENFGVVPINNIGLTLATALSVSMFGSQ